MKEKWKFLWYTLIHPVDGFYEIRHHRKGSLLLALLLVLLFAISFSINRQYASFVVSDIPQAKINSPMEISLILGLYLLFCTANWSVICLTEGSGCFTDILTTTGYSMLPMVLLLIPATILSGAIVQNEEEFYFLLIGFSVLWSFVMLLIGLMQTHEYTLGKTLLSVVFTVIAMLIILFLMLLFFSLMEQVWSFFVSIYNELMLYT